MKEGFSIEEKYFNLVAAAVAGAFEFPRGENRLKAIKANKDFAYSKLLKMFCDCSYNFEYTKLSRMILKRNYEMEEMIKNDQPDEKELKFSNRYNLKNKHYGKN